MTEPYSIDQARAFWDMYFCDEKLKRTSDVLVAGWSLEELRRRCHSYRLYPFEYIDHEISWKDKKVLEFGIGQGNAALWMAEQGAIVTACDIVPSNVELTRQTLDGYPNECVTLQSYEDLDGLGPFDVILSYGCLHHIPEPFLSDAMRHLKGTLKEDGVFLALVYAKAYMPVESCEIEGPYTRGYSEAEIADLFSPDMKVVSLQYVNSDTYIWVAARRPVCGSRSTKAVADHAGEAMTDDPLEQARAYWDYVYYAEPEHQHTRELVKLRWSPGVLREGCRKILADRRRISLEMQPPSEYYKEIDEFDWKDKHVLEFGCGMGADALQLAERGAYVMIADIIPWNVEIADTALDELHHGWTFMNVYNGLRASGKYDVVFSHGVLHHLQPPLDREAMNVLIDCLLPGGKMFLMLYTRIHCPKEDFEREGPYTRGLDHLDTMQLLGPKMQMDSYRLVLGGTCAWVVATKRKE